jgi:hypothetical protein
MQTLNKAFIRRQLYVRDDNEPRLWSNNKGVYLLQFRESPAISILLSLSACNRVLRTIRRRRKEFLMEIPEAREGVVVELHRADRLELEAIVTLFVILKIAH